uniref:rho guanine nucleotide exchange factor 11-like isoform X1 n=1 Tax=Podarcis muralis TaxID=64176 RepID=UPI00109F409A|nr:rho guanine nucleotide exchange factor 11-like isoform X1 [Podarcis muralis]XP_028565019.1 rho guanine nucleotide exchange factor 11-like isoform X1 [Podarcis muralis]
MGGCLSSFHRRNIETPNLWSTSDPSLPSLLGDDLFYVSDLSSQKWKDTVGRHVASSLPQREVDHQEAINELFVTEASHLRLLRVLTVFFYQRMFREKLLSQEELALLFPNLPELLKIHSSLSESMKTLQEQGPIIHEIGHFMLSQFGGPAREEIQQAVSDFCVNQSKALELIETKLQKDTRFRLIIQEAESNYQCRHHQLKDLILSEMQQLTNYPLLLDNIIKHTDGQSSEHQKLCQARDQCREILQCVKEIVKKAENHHRLETYQMCLDTTSLQWTTNTLAAEFKNIDLRSHCLIHEGPLRWRLRKDKTVDLHVLLLENLLLLLQRKDERLVLKCHRKRVWGSSGTWQTISPVLKLNAVLIRTVATDPRAFFVICTSELVPHLYQLVASTPSEKNMWIELLEEAVRRAKGNATLPSGNLR